MVIPRRSMYNICISTNPPPLSFLEQARLENATPIRLTCNQAVFVSPFCPFQEMNCNKKHKIRFNAHADMLLQSRRRNRGNNTKLLFCLLPSSSYLMRERGNDHSPLPPSLPPDELRVRFPPSSVRLRFHLSSCILYVLYRYCTRPTLLHTVAALKFADIRGMHHLSIQPPPTRHLLRGHNSICNRTIL